jgi:hypothetical protein
LGSRFFASGNDTRVTNIRGLHREDHILGDVSGPGALELSAHASGIDLEDRAGDAVDDLTLGPSDYLSSHSRMLVNCARSDFTDSGLENGATCCSSVSRWTSRSPGGLRAG